MRKRAFRGLAAFALTLLMIASLLPVPAKAETVYAISLDGQHRYTSIESAWNAARQGNALVMMSDWNLSERLELEQKEYVILYMNGHTIARKLSDSERNGEVIWMGKNSHLLLMGVDRQANRLDRSFTFSGWTGSGRKTVTLTSGGLITGGDSTNGAGGIHMKDGATLMLDHVLVAGNRADGDDGGGVSLYGEKCELRMSYDAAIAYNRAERGGGVFMDEERCTVSLNFASRIDSNYASDYGGGVFGNDKNQTLSLTEGSGVSDNVAEKYGGAFATIYAGSSVSSSDGTGVMARNQALGTDEYWGQGGAIYYYCDGNDGRTTLSGITFEDNRAGDYGGAVYVEHDNLTISGCTFTGNRAGGAVRGSGGAVCSYKNGLILKNCTITGNKADEEGGGVWQTCDYDLRLEGKMVIKGNTRKDGSPDDLFLEDNLIHTAYVASDPGEDSEVGLRTDADGSDRKVGTSNTAMTTSRFFSDVRGYTVKMEGNRLILKYDQSSYALSVNGVLQGYYAPGTEPPVEAESDDPEKVFRQWTSEPAGDVQFLDNKTLIRTTVSTMPSKDLSFFADYVTKKRSVTLRVLYPEGGVTLPSTGELVWTGEDGTEETCEVELLWLTQDKDGTAKTVTGRADWDEKYSVAVKAEKNLGQGLVFSEDITGKIEYSVSGETDPVQGAVEKIQVDSDGALLLYGKQVKTGKAVIDRVQAPVTLRVTEGTTADALRALLPRTALVYDRLGNGTTVSLGQADLSSVTEGGAVKAGTVEIPLQLDGTEKVVQPSAPAAEKKLTVNVVVEPLPVLDPPKLAPGMPASDTPYRVKDAQGRVTLKVELTAQEGAEIYYKLGDETDYTRYDPAAGIVLTAEGGERKSFEIRTYASMDGYTDSSEAGYRYVLENPFTLTLKKQSSEEGEGALGEDYVAEYDGGEKVEIGAPVVEGYVFEKWTEETGLEIQEEERTQNLLTVDALRNSITLTALYKKEEIPEEDPEPSFCAFTLRYVLKDSDPEVKLREDTQSTGAVGQSAVTEASLLPELTDAQGKRYRCESIGPCVITDRAQDNVFTVYYVPVEDSPEPSPENPEPTPTPSPEDGKAAPAETPEETPEETKAETEENAEELSPKTGDSLPLTLLSMLMLLPLLTCAAIAGRRRG